MSDTSSGTGTKPILPWAAARYRPLEPLAWPAIRLIVGLNLVPHGAQKLFGTFGGRGLEATAAGFEKMGYTPGAFWATMVACTEVFGGILIAIGLLTRPAAVAATIFLTVAVVHHMGNGFFVGKGGYEYALMWAVLAAAIAVRGGGRFSVDRAIGREF